MGAVTTGREIRDARTSSAEWQDWLQSRRVPRLAVPPAEGRLVVVAPHPDDELLACGALLAAHSRRGGRWCIVAVTDGEASHGDTVDTSALAARRRAESERGLAALGLSTRGERGMRLGLGDGAVGQHQGALQDALLAELVPGDTVVSTWRFDGHPDHEATGAAAALACAVRGCTLLEAPVWMWHWAAPGDARVPWHRLRQFAIDSDLSARKSAALDEHASQREDRPGDRGPVLDAPLLARAAWPAEYFFSSER